MEIILEIPKDINKVCRGCLSVTEENEKSFNYHLILTNQLTNICTIFETVTSLKVAVGDGLPESICYNCYELLENASTFKNRCHDSEEKLKILLEKCTKNIDTNNPFEELFEKDIDNNKELIDNDMDNNKEFVEKNVNNCEELIEKDINSGIVTNATLQLEENFHYNCQNCNLMFFSQYQLSIHNIQHNTTKTLSERFLENYNEPEIENTDEGFNTGDALQYILKRKLNMRNSNVEHNAGELFETLKEEEEVKQTFNENLNKPTSSETFHKLCNLCDKSFLDASSLSLHFIKHAFILQSERTINIESEFFFCEVCGELFDCQSNLDIHCIEKHKEKSLWHCNKCCFTFYTEVELLKHCYLSHFSPISPNLKSDSNFTCNLCSEVFSSRTELLNHSPIHLMKKYSCKKCALSFCTQESLNAHLTIHPGLKFYICRTCGKNLSSKTSLRVHMNSVHILKPLHQCSICGKSFASSDRLKSHTKIHSSDKKYICSYCGYSVHTIGDLKVHIRTHTSERPYKCTFVNCEMSFKTSSHLCTHIRRHLQIKKYKCRICLLNFGTGHSLKIHQMQHTGERPHTCTVCLQKFRRKYHLKVHMKQHAKCEN